jgi:cation diffusion facilitator family transporter
MSKQSLGLIEGWVSIVLNTALFAVKYWVGCTSGSVAMIADAWHTLSDTLTSVVVIIGFRASARPADGEHPFGHGRAEAIASIIIGTLLGVVGFEFGQSSIHRLIDHTAASFSTLSIVVFLVSVALKEALARFSFWAGRKINAGSLIADGWHHRSDAVASALIVAGALAGGNLWWMDGVLGIGVSLLIFYAAFSILKSSISISLGEAPDEALDRRIRAVIGKTVTCAEDTHHLHLHRYGDHIELTVHLRVPPEMPVAEAHAVATKVERAIRAEIGAETTVHIEPCPPSGTGCRIESPGR